MDDGVGRRAYYFRGSHIYAHAFQLEGAPASAYIDSAAHSMGMGGDTVQDVEIKLGGADASTPLSTGVVMNIVTPRGQNQYKGSIGYSFQPLDWNGDNTKGGAAPGGLPTFQSVNQWDASLGGRILRDKVWFFGTYRYADLENGISRTPLDLSYLEAFKPGFEPFDNSSVSKQPFLKLTAQLAPGPRALRLLSERSQPLHQLPRAQHRTDQLQLRGRIDVSGQAQLGVGRTADDARSPASFNNKGGNDIDTYSISAGTGPQVLVHQLTTLSGGVPTGNGALVTMDNVQSQSLSPSSMVVLRGDLTYLPHRAGAARMNSRPGSGPRPGCGAT